MTTQAIKVWDPLVRIFHWSLAALFLLTYLTEDDFMDLHVISGYVITGLIVFRLLWGLIGTKHARFSNFVKSPRDVKAYLKDVLLFRAKRYLGHNPAGGMMVIALILSIIITLLTGILVYGAEESAGPLAPWVSHVGDGTADFFEETHEFFANFTLFLVLTHVGGVIITSLQHRENLVRSMINGYKRTHAGSTNTTTNNEPKKGALQ